MQTKLTSAIVGVLCCSAVPGCSDRESQQALRTSRLIGEVGTRPGQIAYPRGIAAGPDHIWIIDKTARVQSLDRDSGRPIATWPMPKFDLGKPTGITIAPGPDGSPALYVADTHEHRVLVFDLEAARSDSTPEPAASFGEYGFGDGQFVYPTDVAVALDGTGRPARYYVSEYGSNDRVSVYDASFTFEFSIGRFGDAVDHAPTEVVLNRPQSVAIDAERDELLVVDAGNHRIGRFTLDGDLIAWFDPRDDAGAPVLHYPYGIEPIGGGRCLITEIGANTVRVIDVTDPGSGVLETFGGAGRDAGRLATPWGVTVIGDEMFVLDSGNHRVQVAPLPKSARRDLAMGGRP